MQNIKFALNSIIGHKMRSFLTMLGIIIGVASVVVIVALGSGLEQGFTSLAGSDRQNMTLTYSPTKSQDGDGILSTEDLEAQAESQEVVDGTEPTIQEAWLQQIVKDVDGIDSYYATNNSTATVSVGSRKVDNINLTGVNDTYFAAKSYKVLAGRLLNEKDYRSFSRVVLLDQKLAETLFSSADKALNQIITIGSNNYRVVGVYSDPDAEKFAAFLSGSGNAILANTQLAAELNLPEIASVTVHAKSLDNTLEAGSEAARRLTQLSNAQGEYQVFDTESQLAQIRSQILVFQLVFGAIAGISLLVGGIGVMNIMLVSVTERTREIGLRKALGATRANILMQFVIESIVLTSIGGAIGLTIAYVIVASIGHSLDAVFLGPPVVTMTSALGSLLFSACVGIVFGFLPANKASKLDPIDALRYE
ncbi:ABC transporter permease [Streptococcus sp. zg-JUN1979]|uniref:ABC transporter permease n=1 Tax=Streptococcus sp. zg-JUN1979 TaxID=3391450 RepID=UPI0039A5026C